MAVDEKMEYGRGGQSLDRAENKMAVEENMEHGGRGGQS